MKDENDAQTEELQLQAVLAFRGPPPMVGWWLARRIHRVGAEFTSRRWWNGNDWSAPVQIGDSDKDAETAREHEALVRPDDMEWMGREQPAVSYPYKLHAKNDFEAFSCAAPELESQNALLLAAYGPGTDDAIKPARRTFNYD